MKKIILVLFAILLVGSLVFAEKLPNPNRHLRDGMRDQGDSCEDPLIAIVGVNSAPHQPVWYEYTATMTGEATISSCIIDQFIDTHVYVYDECDGMEIVSNDDAYCSAYNFASEVTMEIEVGVSYKIFWDDHWSSDPFDWTITESAVLPEILDYSLVYSTDLATWETVVDDVVIVDPAFDYTYLDIETMTTNIPMMVDQLNSFYVNTYPEGWFDYWAAKGVVEGAGDWQGIMWDIINGNSPIMYIKYDGSDYMLVDGLQYLAQQGEQPLRISGDYLLGDYTYYGTVTGEDGTLSENIDIALTFEEPFIAPEGWDCANPYVIADVPFVQTGMTTVGFGDNYENIDNPCGGYYLSGDEFVFSYTPASDIFVDVVLTNTGSYAGAHVIEGSLDDPDPVCIESAGSSSGNPELLEVPLIGGTTYYIIVSTWTSPQTTPFDISITEYVPPTYGDISGYVTDAETSLPIEGAAVVLSDMITRNIEIDKSELTEEKRLNIEEQLTRSTTVYTDATGYYEFLAVETGNYEIACSMNLYEAQNIPVTILEGPNTLDIPLTPIANWNVYLALTVDYYASEASFNLWDRTNETFYWDTDQVFATGSSTLEFFLDLPMGIYDVYCYDTFGDGGIGGLVQDENQVEMLSWTDDDYDELGIFTFYNDIEPGSICELAFDYGPINAPAQTGAIESNEAVWYTFTIEDDYQNVGISLLDSDFDTKLELWGDCGDDTYIAFNDDWNGRSSVNQFLSAKEKPQSRALQSYIPYTYLMAGTYYVKAYGYGSNSGNYVLEITGEIVIASEVEGYVYDSVTSEPIEGAMVAPGISGFEAYTDINGYYYIQNLPTGQYEFMVSCPGYAAISDSVDVLDGLNQFNYYMDPVDYVEIGTGNSLTSYVPVYGNWDYSWTGSIYLQQEVGEAKLINKIAYHVGNEPVDYTMPDQHVYMAHTTESIFTDNTYQYPAGARDFVEVFSGTMIWNAGWIEIILDNPFDYNGIDNLMIWWDNMDGDYDFGGPRFVYTSQTDRAIYKYADGTFPAESTGTISYYLPNIRIYEGEVVQPGETIANAIEVEFDEFNFFNDTGDLSLYADDYDLPFGDGADVVYAVYLPMDALVDVSLQNSDFDTKMALYASDVEPGEDNYLYYNDDYTWPTRGGKELINWARPAQPDKEDSRALQSGLYGMVLDAGLYYLIIDGYNGATGIWDVEITWGDACQELECEGTPEGEGFLPDYGTDTFNGGCNMEVPAFSYIDPAETVCGQLNTYISPDTMSTRDMDWFLSNTGSDFEYYEVVVTLDYDFGDAALWITNGLCGDDLAVYGFYNVEGYCSFEQGIIQIPAGDFGMIVAPPTYEGYAEGFNYALNVEVMEYIPPEDVFINVAVDSWASEASWNVYDYQTEMFLFTEDLTFSAGYEMQTEALILDEGHYSVVCYDTYGDGGIEGNVIHLMQTLTAWGSTDYSTEGWFDFTVGNPITYGDVDGNGMVEAYDTSNLLQYVVGLDPDAVPLPWCENTMLAADVDANEWINAYDGALILQYVVGYIDMFPAEMETRHNAPVASVTVEFINNELVFTANGELYGFEAEISAEFSSVETNLLHAVNGNEVAIASAEAITGEFLRIPMNDDQVTIDMVINNMEERIELTEAPLVTSLKANYPNPFNPETSIAYTVAQEGNVTVQVYNVKGQLVETLVNDHQPAGTYSVVWSAEGQASGVYFYKMKSGRYTSTKKMILMK